MFRRGLLVFVLSFSSSTAYAGMFDFDEFKCGKSDAVDKLVERMRLDAFSELDDAFMVKSKTVDFHYPVSTYQYKLDNINPIVTDVATGGSGSYGINCSATISYKIPPEAMDVLNTIPEYATLITEGGGKIQKGSVVWRNVSYDARLADNGKDIIFSNISASYIPVSMVYVSVFSVNKIEILNALSLRDLKKEQSYYENADSELNSLWRTLPDSARNSLKQEQVAWINEKTKKCGKISDATAESMDANKRTAIYQCQTKMTRERMYFLSKNKNEQ